MIIGVDFDNTIVCYDGIFHGVALEKSLIPPDLHVSKGSVRDYLRQSGKEDIWTEMQGYVYGPRMVDASPFPGVFDFFSRCREKGDSVFIISHRTRYPFLGEQYDLHKSAFTWLKQYRVTGNGGMIPDGNAFFELTKSEKLKRIEKIGCDYFIDDLPEFLSEPDFPVNTKKVLFDPNGQYKQVEFLRGTSWQEIQDMFFESTKQ